MTRYVWEPVERALRGMFYEVLNQHQHPPSLREVWVDMDRPARGDATVIAEFERTDAAPHRPTYQQVIHDADQLRESWFGLRRRARGRVRYEAHSLYSQVIENNLLERELRSARDRLAEFQRVCPDPARLQQAYEMYHRQCEVIQRNHQMRHSPYQGFVVGADFGLGDYTATQTFTSNSTTSNLTATQQSLMQRQLGRAMDQQVMNALQGGGWADQSALNAYSANNTATQALSYEQMRNAYSALRPGTADNDINALYSYWTSAVTVPLDYAFGSTIGSEEANKKGLTLLKENLTPEQLRTYEAKQYFDVKGGKSGKTYRIHHGRQMNIRELDADGKEVQGLCFLPQGGLVAGDCMLAQKNALELDEDKALKVANKFAVGGDPRPSDVQIAEQQMQYEQARMQMLYGARMRDNRGLFGTLFTS